MVSYLCYMGQCWTQLGRVHYSPRYLVGGKVNPINKIQSWEEKLTEAQQNEKIVVVKFAGTRCAPSKEIAPTYRELANKNPSLVFLAVDVDEMALGRVHYSPRYLVGGKVNPINKIQSWEEKLTEAQQNEKIVVVKFAGTRCAPSKEIAPTYRELANKNPSLVFLAVDVDEMAEFSNDWDIKATPTFYFLKDGQPVDKLVGADKVDLQKKVANIAESASKM